MSGAPTIVSVVRDLKRQLRANGAIVGPTVRGTIRPTLANYDRSCGREPSDWFEIYLPDVASPEWERFMKRFKGSDEEIFAAAKREQLLPQCSGVILVTETLAVNVHETLGAKDSRLADVIQSIGLSVTGKL